MPQQIMEEWTESKPWLADSFKQSLPSENERKCDHPCKLWILNPAIALQIRAGPSRSRPIRETHFPPIILGRQFANGDASTNDAASVPRQAILVARPERQPEVAQSDFRLSSAHHDRDRSIAFEKGHRWPAIAGRPSRIAGCRR
jgi:hypothetical protein